MTQQTLQQLLTDRIQAYTASERPAELIDAGIDKMFKDVVDDTFRSYGDFSKTIKEAVKAALPANVSDFVELERYNALIANALKDRWEQAAVESMVLKTADQAISEVLTGDGLITGEVSLSELLQELVDSNKDEARENGWEAPEIRFEEDDRYSSTYLSIFFDPEPESSHRTSGYSSRDTRSNYALKHRICVKLTGEHRPAANSWNSPSRLGEVYSACLDDKKIDLRMSVRTKWERMLASLYFGNAVLLVDCDPDDFSYNLDD